MVILVDVEYGLFLGWIVWFLMIYCILNRYDGFGFGCGGFVVYSYLRGRRFGYLWLY